MLGLAILVIFTQSPSFHPGHTPVKVFDLQKSKIATDKVGKQDDKALNIDL